MLKFCTNYILYILEKSPTTRHINVNSYWLVLIPTVASFLVFCLFLFSFFRPLRSITASHYCFYYSSIPLIHMPVLPGYQIRVSGNLVGFVVSSFLGLSSGLRSPTIWFPVQCIPHYATRSPYVSQPTHCPSFKCLHDVSFSEKFFNFVFWSFFVFGNN